MQEKYWHINLDLVIINIYIYLTLQNIHRVYILNFEFFELSVNHFSIYRRILRVCSAATVSMEKKNFSQSDFFFPARTVFRPLKLNPNPSPFPFSSGSRRYPKSEYTIGYILIIARNLDDIFHRHVNYEILEFFDHLKKSIKSCSIITPTFQITYHVDPTSLPIPKYKNAQTMFFLESY